MKSTSKTKFRLTFCVVLVMIRFIDLILIIYILVDDTTIEGTMKENRIEIILYYYFRRLTPKNLVLIVHWSTFSKYFTMLSLKNT